VTGRVISNGGGGNWEGGISRRYRQRKKLATLVSTQLVHKYCV